MSNHFQKYPGLYARCKAARVSYQVMYFRIRSGMTIDEAFAMPVRKRGRPRQIARGEPERGFLWERSEWNTKAAGERRLRTRYTPWPVEDTSPQHIRDLRARYCDHFIKTGMLDEGMSAQLRAYADEQRATQKHPARVPDEPASQRYSRERARAGNDGDGDALQTDRSAARRIADFLRT